MSQPQTESTPPRRRRAARRVRPHGGRCADDRTRPVDDLPADGRGQVPVAGPPRQASRRVAPNRPRAVERGPAHGAALRSSQRAIR